MKKITFLLLTLLFFTSYAWSQCESALALTPGTDQSGDTSSFGELFSDTCLGNYDDGYDGLFSYTANEEGESLSISLTSSNTWTGVSISEGCPSGGGSCIVSDTGGTSFSLDSGPLTAGVTYYVHFSTYPTPYAIQYTLSSTINPPADCPTAAISSFPYSFGFENLDCWTNSNSSAAWAIDQGNNYGPGSVTEGVNSVFFNDYDYSEGSTGDLMSPDFDFGALTTARVSFDYWDGTQEDVVEVLVDDGSGPVVVFTTEDVVSTWTTINVDLPQYANQTVKIGFRGTSVWGSTNPHIDNFMISEAPSCLEPSALSASSVTADSAELSWTAGDSETLWNIEVVDVTAGETADGSVDYTSSINSYSLTSLSANNEYEVYVQADCGAGDTSTWTGPLSFTTLCEAVTEFSENFDGVTTSTFPNCWGKIGSSGSVYLSTSYDNSAPNALYLYSSSTSNLAVVGMTPVSNLGAGTHRFTFNMRANFTSGGIVEIGYLTDGNDPDSFISLGNVVSNSTSYESYSFTPPAGTYTNYPAMRHTGSPANSVSIDDVVWEEIPSCLAPSALSASNVTTDSADISWTSDESSFNVEVVDVTAGGTATGTATYSDVTSPYSLSGLDSNTEYEVYIQTDCGSGGTSAWAGPVSFTTAVTCGHIIYDSGGATGDYANNELLIVTAFPDTAGELVTFTFDSFATESGWDKIWVYDGPDTSSSVLIDGVSGSTIPNPVTSSHSTGALTFKFDSDGSTVDAGFQVTVSCAPPPSCTTPTALAMDNITDSSADVSWIAGDSETLWNIEVVDVTAGETADGSVDYTSSANSYSLTSLSANNEYEVYVQADCGVDGTSEWSVAASFTTDCAVFSQSYNHGFDADNHGIVADASCWAVINQGSTNGWFLMQDTTTGNVYWNLTYSSVQHSDWLISPTFTVTDNLTDAFAFDGWNGNPSWGNEVIDVLVYDTNLTLLGTLATDLSLPAESEDTNFVYDLSSYENQDIRIAFYSSTEYLSYSRIDNFQVDSYTSLGIQDNSISLFNYFPNPVNDVLTIKAQKVVEDITVFNMLGQVVTRQTPNTRDCTVNLSTMQTGAYFVQVSIDNSVETVRILKN